MRGQATGCQPVDGSPDQLGGMATPATMTLAQTLGMNLEPGQGPDVCRVPGTDGKSTASRDALFLDVIREVVNPQLVDRQADDAVYCSCRCAGPDANARYCECPDGYTCSNLVRDLGLGRGQLTGSYCIKQGTEFDRRTGRTGPECNANTTNCGNSGQNPPILGAQ